MQTYPVPMVPGPVKVPKEVLEAYSINYGSADLETEFFQLVAHTQDRLKVILGTENSVVVQSGEGMLALWSALKSCIVPGDRVLSVATGIFGHGIAEMASLIGAQVEKVSTADNETISDMDVIEDALKTFRPKMITAVHCETPSGTLNPLKDLGTLKKDYDIPLFYVDAVASAGGVPVLVDTWNIDLCLGGSQKCLSSLPDMSFLSVSDKAWEIIESIDYVGYDALKPFRYAVKSKYFPYTPNWQATAALKAGADLILTEGLENSFARHSEAASFCRKFLVETGCSLFPAAGAVPSPTVTAAYVPEGMSWTEFDGKLRKRGLVVGGSYGDLAGKIFRIGHMGSQADMDLVKQAMAIISAVI